MTESEWLACTEPEPMLEYLEGGASDRKLRLFAMACCQRIWRLLTDSRSRGAVEIAEKVADGKVGREELTFGRAAADRAHFEAPRSANFRSLDAAPNATEDDAFCSATDTAASAADAMQLAASGDGTAKVMERQQQAHLVRDIFGNPFRPVTFEPAWLTVQVLELVQSIYEERAFDRMPILGEALEAAGCDNADILSHCRDAGPHVRGCWVVDAILGKS